MKPPVLLQTGNDHGQAASASPSNLSVASGDHLKIIPAFDPTITGDPQAATIEAGINADISVLESHIATPITVNILFASSPTGLGGAAMYYNSNTYSAYRLDLRRQKLSVYDKSALATLPGGPNNPVDGTRTSF